MIPKLHLNIFLLALFVIGGGHTLSQTMPIDEGGRNYMGDIYRGPQFVWTKTFDLSWEGSKLSYVLEVSMVQRNREDGLADPSRPGGPDNRKIVQDTSYDIWIKGKDGNLVKDEELSKKVVEFRDEIKKGGTSIYDEEAFVNWAKAKYGVFLKFTGKK